VSPSLNGRRVLVVGAGTRPSSDPDAPPGNGRATAILAARSGAVLTLADWDREAVAETARLVAAEGSDPAVVVGDVAEPNTCAAIVARAVEAMSGIDGVVLNVGIGLGSRLADTSAAQWDRVFTVNVRSHFLVTKAALPHMSGGSIVFVSSVAGLKPGSTIPAYDSSKAALAGLCRHVALEGARAGVRANVVAPGLIDTPLGRLASAGRPGRDRTPVPLGRQGSPWEVAQAVLFFLSEDSSYITGQVLAVDGGLSTLR
jgi:NAD(P)-dependent dehydrogenase (short-subunit alcohol dehydrogenase family)